MPSDDLVLNVRQVAGYSPTANAPPSSALLIQLGGLGGPYASISPAALVATALSSGGDMAIAGALAAQSVSAGTAQFSNGVFGMFSAQKACIVDLAATWGTIAGVPIATVNDISCLDAALRASTVWSFNGRRGDVRLWIDDIRCAGGAPIFSPRFEGSPRACTPPPESNSTRLATTAFVMNAIASMGVSSFNGREGAVVLEAADVTALALPYAPIDSPNFTGYATAPTPVQGASTGQIATTAFVMNAVADSVTGVVSFNTRTGAVLLLGADITGAGGALLASPAFTGIPTGPTAAPGTNTAQLATCAFVEASAGENFAPINSPAFTGTPTAPTPALGTNSTQLATTAYVLNAITSVDAGVLSFNGRTGVVSLLANDISAAGGAVLGSPAFTGVPTAPTAAPATSNGQLATTAFVTAAIAALPAVPLASTTTPLMDGTAAVGNGTTWARSNHVHPSDTSRLALTGGTLTGTLVAPNVNVSNNVSIANQISATNGGTIGGVSLVSGSLTAPGDVMNVGSVTVSNGAIAYGANSGVNNPGSFIGFGFQLAPSGYGAIQVAAAGEWLGYVVRSVAVAGSTFGVTLLQLSGALTSAYVVADGGNTAGWSTSPSDARLKRNIGRPAKDALAIVNEIEVSQCDFRHPLAMGGGEHWDFTILADEVKAVMPYAYMAPPTDQGFASLHPLHLISTLWRAVQQLTERVAALETRTT